MTFVLVLPLVLIAALFAERYWHNRWLKKIQLRISVNGTRGKSSITQYIAMAFRENGHRTLAKITGTEPAFIDPEGKKIPILRIGSPRIQEQMKVVRKAAAENAEILVAECMAVTPEFQLIDSRLIQPHILVISNILDDHREQFKGDLQKYAAAVCDTIPWNGKVVTNEKRFLPLIKRVAKERESTVHLPELTESDDLPSHIHQVNVDCAIEVCVLAGMQRQDAETAIISGLKRSHDSVCHRVGDRIRYINGLAANEPASADHMMGKWQESGEQKCIVLHTRNDRPLRTLQFTDWIGSRSDISRVFLSGNHKFVARNTLISTGIPVKNIQSLGEYLNDFILNSTADKIGIYGFGNAGAGGVDMWQALLTYSQNRYHSDR